MDINSDELRQKQQFYVDTVERLNGGAIERLSLEQLYLLIDDITVNSPFILQPINTSSKLCRGRILNNLEQANKLSDLSYPPAKKCNNFGRCHSPNNPMLYSGIGSELIFSEIKAQIGDIVGLLHFQPKHKLLFLRLGALDLWRRTYGHCILNENIKEQINDFYNKKYIVYFLLDAFISDYFSRPGSDLSYKLTSTYTSSILNSKTDIAGIIYDSVNHTKGNCIAIKPDFYDNYFIPTEVQIVQITSYLGYGIYDFKLLKFSDEFNDNNIIWK